MVKKIQFKKPLAFEWDEGNRDKNVIKHNIQNRETEEVFVNDPVILPDRTHSQTEERYFAFGKTDKERYLLISFTLRGEQQERIRPIMSRDQNKIERIYFRENEEVKKRK